VRDELLLVLVVCVPSELSLLLEVGEGSLLSVSSSVLCRSQTVHRVLKGLAFLLEVGTARLDLAVQVRVLVVGSGELSRKRVESFPERADLGL
jgi:hypothetical protein